MTKASDADPNGGRYPEFVSLDQLITVEDLAVRLQLTRKSIMDARYDNPGLPFFRLGKKIYIAEPQFVWWLNQKQRLVPDKYWMDRKRRILEGSIIHKPSGDFAKSRKKKT